MDAGRRWGRGPIDHRTPQPNTPNKVQEATVRPRRGQIFTMCENPPIFAKLNLDAQNTKTTPRILWCGGPMFRQERASTEVVQIPKGQFPEGGERWSIRDWCKSGGKGDGVRWEAGLEGCGKWQERNCVGQKGDAVRGMRQAEEKEPGARAGLR